MVLKNVKEMSPVPEVFKYTSQFYSNTSNYTKINTFRLKKSDRKRYMENVKKYVDFARYFLCQTPKDLDEIEKAYEIETVADEKEVAMKLRDWGKTHLDTMDYTDMIWLLPSPTAVPMFRVAMTLSTTASACITKPAALLTKSA